MAFFVFSFISLHFYLLFTFRFCDSLFRVLFVFAFCSQESGIFVTLTGVMNNTHTHIRTRTIYWLRKSDIAKSVKWKRNGAKCWYVDVLLVCVQKKGDRQRKDGMNILWMCVCDACLFHHTSLLYDSVDQFEMDIILSQQITTRNHCYYGRTHEGLRLSNRIESASFCLTYFTQSEIYIHRNFEHSFHFLNSWLSSTSVFFFFCYHRTHNLYSARNHAMERRGWKNDEKW